jgi:hypothetical protein
LEQPLPQGAMEASAQFVLDVLISQSEFRPRKMAGGFYPPCLYPDDSKGKSIKPRGLRNSLRKGTHQLQEIDRACSPSQGILVPLQDVISVTGERCHITVRKLALL